MNPRTWFWLIGTLIGWVLFLSGLLIADVTWPLAASVVVFALLVVERVDNLLRNLHARR